MELSEQAIELRRDLLGPNDPDVLVCLDRLVSASLTYGLESLKNGQMLCLFSLEVRTDFSDF